MPIRLDSRTADFDARFRDFLATKREAAADVEAAVRAIIAEVVAGGDRALIELTREFDRVDLERVGMRVMPAEIAAACAVRSEEHTSELQSPCNLVCRLLLEK